MYDMGSAGMYEEHLARANQMLADAEFEYQDAVIKMADSAPAVREYVLGGIQEKIDEAKQMIAAFTPEA